MKYDLNTHKLIEISPEWIDKLVNFGKQYHPEVLAPTGPFGRLNAINMAKSINKLAELYFKEVLKAF